MQKCKIMFNRLALNRLQLGLTATGALCLRHRSSVSSHQLGLGIYVLVPRGGSALLAATRGVPNRPVFEAFFLFGES